MRKIQLALALTVALAVSAGIFWVTSRPKTQSAPQTSELSVPVLAVNASPKLKEGFPGVKDVLDNFCVKCHSGEDPEAGVSLSFRNEAEANAKAKAEPEFFELVMHVIEDNAMPPKRATARPSELEKDAVVKWAQKVTAWDGVPNPGRFVLHRLNRREYANTIRDLFYLPESYDAAADFPPDERGDGFDNNSDTLVFSPLLLERYLDAAEKAINDALNIDNKFGSNTAKNRINLPLQGYREDFADWQQKARIVVTTMLPRVYRRPVTKEELDEVMKFGGLALTHDGESISRATGYPLRAALMSPEFLFRMERDPNDDGTGKIYQIGEFPLASRLSYFLWSTMPDDDLFLIAQDGKLRENLSAQVTRMLKHPKAISLTKDFMGQWLEIRGLDKTTNCPPELLAAMQGETEHFFDYIVREDRSIMEMLDADYTFLNQKLAEHYGITGVSGNEFQKVNVDVQQRGGIFTQASFLTLTAKPLGASRRTSPVNRGKWILENIFNERIPLPPPNVPSLAIDDGKELKGTVRQIFEQHRENPDCISCHAKMDPYGFALENYDGFGVWRKQDNKVDVDPSGEIRGKKYSNPREFRTILAGRQDDFRRAFVTKMLSYALARGIANYDKPAIDAICEAVKADGDKFSSVILNIVKSYPFQHARSSVVNKTQEN